MTNQYWKKFGNQAKKEKLRAKYLHQYYMDNAITKVTLKRVDRNYASYIYRLLTVDESFDDSNIINMAFNTRSNNEYLLFVQTMKQILHYANKIKYHRYSWPFETNAKAMQPKGDTMAKFLEDFPITFGLAYLAEVILVLTGDFSDNKENLFMASKEIADFLDSTLVTRTNNLLYDEAALLAGLSFYGESYNKLVLYIKSLLQKIPADIKRFLDSGNRTNFRMYRKMSINYKILANLVTFL